MTASSGVSRGAAVNGGELVAPALLEPDALQWLIAASGWLVAGVLGVTFLVPICYWLGVYSLAIVGFVSIATGRAKSLWPPIEHVGEIIQQLTAAVQQLNNRNTQSIANPAKQPG
jgi:hypothetical protein